MTSLNLSRHCPRGSCCADENVIHLFSECEFAMIVFTVVFVNVHSEQPENTMWSHNTTFCAFRAVSKDTLRQTLTVPQDYNPLKGELGLHKTYLVCQELSTMEDHVLQYTLTIGIGTTNSLVLSHYYTQRRWNPFNKPVELFTCKM